MTLQTALKVSAAMASNDNDRTMRVLKDLIADQWRIAAEVTEKVDASVRRGMLTGEEGLAILLAEFERMART
jgi:hypothetical protein